MQVEPHVFFHGCDKEKRLLDTNDPYQILLRGKSVTKEHIPLL